MLVLTDSDPSTAIMSSEPPVVPGSSGGPNVHCLTPGPGRDFPHSPSMAPSFPRHLQPSGGPCTPQSGPASQQHHQWDINDNSLPMPSMYDPFELWPSGHYRRVYRGDSDDARRHVSGWAMRNTNNHNALILKKSCLGVLVCSRDCLLESGQKVHLRPAICDKARRKQIGKSCPNPGCTGKLELLSCRGHCGYPVTHFWRHVNNSVYFQAKGYHDHPRPEVKSLSEKGRQSLTKQLRHSGGRFLSAPTKRRFPILTTEDIPDRNIFMPAEDEVMCSCPPFECVCPKSAPRPNFIPSSLGYFKETPPHTFLPHRASPHPVPGMEPLPHGPFTQINITNTCVPPTSVDVNIPGIEIYQNFPRLGHHNHFYDPDMKMLRYGNNEDSSSSVSHNQSLHKNPEDDFRSLNIHSSSSSISLQNSCTSRTFDNGTSISTLSTRADARDSYDKYKSYGGHILSKHRTNQANTEERFQCLNRSLKPEPVDNVFSSSPPSSCAEDLSRPFPADSLYDQVSPAFSEQPIRSPTLLEARSKFDHPHDDNNKEQHQQDGQQTPTYITLTPSQGSVEGRELHSCRLGHINKSPNTVPSSLDSFLCPPSAALPTKVETMGTLPTPTFPRHHSSRDHVSNTSPSPMRLTSPCMPRLVLEDNESPGDSLRNSAINLSTQTHHDPSMTPFSLNNDIPAPPYPPPGTACGNTPSVPYGFYCNDIFQSPSQQAYRNHSINITLTYN